VVGTAAFFGGEGCETHCRRHREKNAEKQRRDEEEIGQNVKGETKKKEGVKMLGWAITFAIIAIIAAVLGFGIVAGTAATIAKIAFIVFVVLFVASVIRSLAVR